MQNPDTMIRVEGEALQATKLFAYGLLIYCMIGIATAIPANTMTGVNTNNLRNYYQFEENVSTFVVDRGSVPINLTWTNPAWSTNRIQGNFSGNFSGGNALNETDAFSYYNGKTTVSIGGWFNASTQSGTGRIGLFDNGCSATMFTIEYVNKTRIHGVIRTGSGEFYTNNATITGDKWHHVVLTYNGTLGIFYVDGIQSSNVTVTGGGIVSGCPATDFAIAQAGSYRGLIDDLGLFNITLTASQILEWNNTAAPSITFFNLTPNSGTTNYFPKNYIEIGTTINSFTSYGNTSIKVFYENGSIAFSNISASNITNVNVTGLAIGTYYYNATAFNTTNGVVTFTETRSIVIYNLSAINITIPSAGQSVYQFLNITWTNTSSTNNSVAISNYTIQLLNSTQGFNRTLNVTGSNRYVWNTYPENLLAGTYYIRVIGTDANGNTVNTSVTFSLASNGILNITAYDILLGSSLSTFNISVDDGTSTSLYNTTNGFIPIDIVIGKNYTVGLTSTGYVFDARNSTPNSSYTSLQFTNLVLTNCSSNVSTRTLNISYYNEESTNAKLNATTEIDISVWYNNPVNAYNYSIAFPAREYHEVCIYPPYLNLTANMYIKYTAPNGFTQRFYYINEPFSSGIKNLRLYNFNNTAYSVLKIILRNSDTFQFYSDIYASLQRFYVGEGTWRTIQMDKSGLNGEVNFNIRERDTDYRVIYQDIDGNTLLMTAQTKFICTSSLCTVTSQLTPFSSSNENNEASIDLSFNNATKILTLTYDNAAGNTNIELEVIQLRNTNTTACSTSQYASSGTLNCNLTGYTGIVGVNVIQDDSPIYGGIIDLGSFNLGSSLPPEEQATWALVIEFVAVFIGIGFGAVGIVISSIIGIIITLWLQIYSALTITVGVVITIIGCVIAILLEK